jgi:hypothetical protein
MKCILIPIDFTAVTHNVLDYAAAFCKQNPVEKVILFRNFHVPLIAQVLPDANMIEVSAEEVREEKELTREKLRELGEVFAGALSADIQVICFLAEGKWLASAQNCIEKYKPDLVMLGNDPIAEDNESIIAEKIVPFSKSSSVPVLLIPKAAVYQKLKKVLLPTSFENLERLHLMEELCISQAWLDAEILVLNVDPDGRNSGNHEKHLAILGTYLNNYHFQVSYSYAKNIVQTILDFAQLHEVQLIMALPGQHNFFYNLTHRSVTETFALGSNHPVLLLK